MVQVHQQLNGCHTQFEHYPVFTKFGSHLSIDFSAESGMQFSFFVYHATYVNLGLSCGKDNHVREVKYLATWLVWLRFWVATTWHKPFTVALWFVEKTWKPFSQLKQNKLRDSRCSWNAIAYCQVFDVACPNSRMIGPVEDMMDVDASEMQQQKLEDFPRLHWKSTKLRTGFKDLSYQQPWIAGFWLV